jgi:hypothetical protein
MEGIRPPEVYLSGSAVSPRSDHRDPLGSLSPIESVDGRNLSLQEETIV